MRNDLQDPTGRIFWQDGQVLDSRDLLAVLRDEERHRRLHNRYLHATWGIAFGFTATLDQDHARLKLSPGYAIDVEGRDLLLAETLTIRPPSGGGTFILAASYKPTSNCRPPLPEADFCTGLDPRRNRAAVEWIAAADLNFGEQVPSARATFTDGEVQGDLDFNVRHYARRLARPQIGYGITQAGSSNWTDVSVPKRPDFWLQADVDTSEAGFVNTPRYFASLCRQSPARKQPRQDSLDETAAALGSQPALSLDGLGVVVKATATKFTYRVPRGELPFGVDLSASEAEAGGWVVAWVGFEHPAGDQPELDLQLIAAAMGVIL